MIPHGRNRYRCTACGRLAACWHEPCGDAHLVLLDPDEWDALGTEMAERLAGRVADDAD